MPHDCPPSEALSASIPARQSTGWLAGLAGWIVGAMVVAASGWFCFALRTYMEWQPARVGLGNVDPLLMDVVAGTVGALALLALCGGRTARRAAAGGGLALMVILAVGDLILIPRIEKAERFKIAPLPDNSLLTLTSLHPEMRRYALRALLSGAYPGCTVFIYRQLPEVLAQRLGDAATLARVRARDYNPELTVQEAEIILKNRHEEVVTDDGERLILFPGLPLAAGETFQVLRHEMRHLLLPARMVPSRMRAK